MMTGISTTIRTIVTKEETGSSEIVWAEGLGCGWTIPGDSTAGEEGSASFEGEALGEGEGSMETAGEGFAGMYAGSVVSRGGHFEGCREGLGEGVTETVKEAEGSTGEGLAADGEGLAAVGEALGEGLGDISHGVGNT